jgi:DNA-directed RNA polymerase subunit RPC12/RpoP
MSETAISLGHTTWVRDRSQTSKFDLPVRWLPPEPAPGQTRHFPIVCPSCGHRIGFALESAGGAQVGDRVLGPRVLYCRLPGLVRISPPGESPPRYGTRRRSASEQHSTVRHALVRGTVVTEAGSVIPIRFGGEAFEAVEPVFIVMCANCGRRVHVDVAERPAIDSQQ